jgi:hypothetical protein
MKKRARVKILRLTVRTTQRDQLLDFAEQRRNREGLVQKMNEAGFEEPGQIGEIKEPAENEHGRDSEPRIGGQLEKIPGSKVRQSEIGDDEVDLIGMLSEKRDGARAVSAGENGIACRLENEGDQVNDGRFVVREENCRGCCLIPWCRRVHRRKGTRNRQGDHSIIGDSDHGLRTARRRGTAGVRMKTLRKSSKRAGCGKVVSFGFMGTNGLSCAGAAGVRGEWVFLPEGNS